MSNHGSVQPCKKNMISNHSSGRRSLLCQQTSMNYTYIHVFYFTSMDYIFGNFFFFVIVLVHTWINGCDKRLRIDMALILILIKAVKTQNQIVNIWPFYKYISVKMNATEVINRIVYLLPKCSCTLCPEQNFKPFTYIWSFQKENGSLVL